MSKTKLVMGLFMAIILTASVSAQDRPNKSPEDRAQKMTERMTEKMQLSEDQQSKVYEANLELVSNMKKNREEMMALSKQHEAKMESILNEEQLEKYKAGKEKRMDHMKNRRKFKKDPYPSEEDN